MTGRVAVLMVVVGVSAIAVGDLRAQGYGSPLTMQGVNHFTIASSESRAVGGISVGLMNDPSLMFTNPASLATIDGIRLSVGGIGQSQDLRQTQEWYPLRSFPTFSLTMEGLIDQIKDPDLSNPPPEGLGPEDSIPRPFDHIKPNWSRAMGRGLPLQATAAAPVELLGIRFIAGLGLTQYANLDYYFQNNNVLSPSIGSQRPYGVPLPGIGQETVVQWTREFHQREGSLYGYGVAVSAEVLEDLSVGVSGLLIRGLSDDVESSTERAQIRFGNNNNVYYYKLDSVFSTSGTTGQSRFKGVEYAVSSQYRGKYVALGLSVKLPANIYRKFEGTLQRDTTGSSTAEKVVLHDRMTIPWRTIAGISLSIRNDMTLGLEYEARPFGNAEFKDAGGRLLNPWASGSVFRVGLRYVPMEWLTFAVGFRNEAEVFQEEGNPLVGDPVRYDVYSVGAGMTLEGVRINVEYDYVPLNYQDLWQTNANLNAIKSHTVTASLSYTLP